MGLRNKQFARGSAGWLLIKSCKYKVSVDVCSLADPMQSRRCTFDPHGLTGAHDVYCSVPARKTISYGSFPGWRPRKLGEAFRKKRHLSLGTVYRRRSFGGILRKDSSNAFVSRRAFLQGQIVFLFIYFFFFCYLLQTVSGRNNRRWDCKATNIRDLLHLVHWHDARGQYTHTYLACFTSCVTKRSGPSRNLARRRRCVPREAH